MKTSIFYMLFILISLSLVQRTYSQSLQNKVFFEFGYGSYEMRNLSKYQNQLLDFYEYYDIPLKIVEQFPEYWNFKLHYLRSIDQAIDLGGYFGYASTGGRVHYSDYSGEIKFDQVVKSKIFGAHFDYSNLLAGNLDYIISFQIFVSFTELKIQNSIKISTQETFVTENFNSFGFGIEPSVGIRYDILPFFVRANIGFVLDYNNIFKLDKNSDVELKISDIDINPDWLGYRVGLSFGYMFDF